MRTVRPDSEAPRLRCPDPLAAVTADLHCWFEAEPWRTSRELLERLQAEQPNSYPDKLLRTLQRRVKVWRQEQAHRLVFGVADAGSEAAAIPTPGPEMAMPYQGLSLPAKAATAIVSRHVTR